ncbi:unnamed protein product [Psylliodes chrysocephalus]|uniref:DUF4806 domain-containing protein n=1 Tax=Psylliodes chrysocephalus TaxID=3402493 RepID=A0A9P0CF98_9CUCU|nr:unnamed protein product [Psylliodes chrysocephala]
MKMVNIERISEFETLDSQLNFTNYKDLEDFNNKLSDEHYFNKMKLSISLLGGRDLSDSTRKIASLLISHELILKMNWTGVNEKFSLVKLQNILKLIYVSVR